MPLSRTIVLRAVLLHPLKFLKQMFNRFGSKIGFPALELFHLSTFQDKTFFEMESLSVTGLKNIEEME